MRLYAYYKISGDLRINGRETPVLSSAAPFHPIRRVHSTYEKEEFV